MFHYQTIFYCRSKFTLEPRRMGLDGLARYHDIFFREGQRQEELTTALVEVLGAAMSGPIQMGKRRI